MSTSSARPGQSQLAGFRGPEPEKGESDEPITAPVADDDTPPAASDRADDDAPAPPAADAPPAPPPKPPSDAMRDKIASRFSKNRNDLVDGQIETPPADDAGDEGKSDGEGEKPPAAAAAQGDAPPAADKFELKVNGKTVTKSIAEIAVLADMTEEEVRAKPELAQKFARKELATSANLDEAKRIRREAHSATRTDEGDAPPAARPAPSQERKPAVQDDGQSETNGDPSHVDFKKLAETLQVDDPETAAQALEDAFNRIGEKVTKNTISKTEHDNRINTDRNSISTALTDFVGEHPEVANKYVASAMATSLIDEYRVDLTAAMIAEGRAADEEEAAEILAQVTPDQIAEAHQHRRMNGDRNVRRISRDFIASAYDRVQKDLGLTKTEPKTGQNLTEQRRERKVNLAPQPPRASTPPASPQAPQAPTSRRSVVSDIRAMRGQKTPTAR